MKMNFSTMKQQAQDFVLRLFIESYGGSGTTLSSSFYTCAHCGTFSRLKQ